MSQASAKTRKARSATASEQDIEPLRFAAEMYYTLTPGEVSLDAMASVSQFAHLGIKKLQQWADKDSWVARRAQHQDRMRSLLHRRLAQSLVDDRVKQMEDQQWICDEGMSMLENEMLQPKLGWEGMAGTVVATMRNMEQMRKDVITELSGGDAGSQEQQGTMSSFDESITQEEAAAAARALVEVRQKALRQMPLPAKK